MLRKRLLTGREEQQAPFLYGTACLSPIIRTSFAGAVAEHVDGLADNASVAHADFIQDQKSIRVRGSD
ncbi:hypothetical protein D3C76_1808470 [compost metagenome]